MSAAAFELIVTGATGYVGAALMRQLVASRPGLRARVLVSRAGRVVHPGVTEVVGRLPDVLPDFVPARPHVIVHCGVKQIDADGTGFDATNVAGTGALLAQCNPHTLGFIYHSSLSVLGQGPHRAATEDTDVAPATALAHSRARAEAEINSAMSALGRPAYLLRPRFIVGGDDRFVGPGFRRLAARRLRIGSGHQAYSIIHCDDYAELILRLAEAIARGEATGGGPLHVGYRRPVSHDELVAGVTEQAPAPRWRIPVPTWLPRVLRTVSAGRADQLATRLELVGFDHYACTRRLEALLGADVVAKNPLDALTPARSNP